MSAFLKESIGWFVGKFVLSAQWVPLKKSTTPLKRLWQFIFYSQAESKRIQALFSDFERKNENKGLDRLIVQRFQVSSTDNVSLDTVEMYHPQNKNAQKYIVYGWGRPDYYERNLDRLATDALNLKAHVISFNYRGIGHSSGQPYSQDDLVEDYYHQVDRLIKEKKIDPSQIICHGHSLGGAVATLTADKLHAENKRVRLYNDRSFNHLVRVSVGVFFEKERPRKIITGVGTFILSASLLAPLMAFSVISLFQASIVSGLIYLSMKNDSTYPFWDKLVANTLSSWMQSLMYYSNWVMDVADVYNRLPKDCKDYTVIKGYKRNHNSRFLGAKHCIEPVRDKVIYPLHALHHSVDKEDKRHAKRRLSSNNELTGDRLRDHQLLVRLSNVKVTGGGHMDRPRTLTTRYCDTRAGRAIRGNERLYDFLEPEEGHIQPKPRQYKMF